MRYGALFIGLLLPAIYIALTVYHRNLMPDMLLQIIDESRDNLPYSAVWEVLGLLMAFELLQESGVHLPQSIGQSVSIIGGIVLGSAAVDAGVISPMALIVVSITGISGFVLPNRDFAAAIRVSRFALALAASVLGLTGLIIGLAILAIHLLRLKSLGVPYLVFFEPNILRKRMVKSNHRDKHLHPKDRKNQDS